MQNNTILINGKEVDVTTVMDTTVKYNATIKESMMLKDRAWELLSEYFDDILVNGFGLGYMFQPNGNFFKAKGWLIELFKKHPCYNGNYQIVLKNQPISRYIDMKFVGEFRSYIYDRIGKLIKENTEYVNPETGEIISEEEARIILDDLYVLERKYRHDWNCASPFSVEEREADKKITEVRNKIDSCTRIKDKAKFEFIITLIDYIDNYLNEEKNHIINETFAEWFNAAAPSLGFRTKVQPGQKISKIFQKVAKEVGLDKHVDIQDYTFVRNDGAIITRQKDMGWNHWYSSIFSDNINPIEQKGTAVISVNPIDFWTMSFGLNWASCHTIDKRNKRRITSGHVYSGCYCGGTESLMFDKVSIIFYYLKDDFNGNRPELEDKVKRCVFYLGEDKLIQSRVYPDGRDGGDKSLAGDMRNIMQKVIADLYEVPNFWKNEKGTSVCTSMINTIGSHYPDYQHYDDCNVSFLKRIDGYLNRNRITVGAKEICPECGDEHLNEDNIFCEECAEGLTCENCGTSIRRDDAYDIDGYWYCPDCTDLCESCNEVVRSCNINETERGGYVCDCCITQNYTYSSWLNEYVDDDDVIRTEEGRICSSYNEGNGYFECSVCHDIHNEEESYVDDDGNEYCEDCYDEYLAELERQSEEEEQ